MRISESVWGKKGQSALLILRTLDLYFGSLIHQRIEFLCIGCRNLGFYAVGPWLLRDCLSMILKVEH